MWPDGVLGDMGLSSPTCNCSPAFQDCFSLQSLQDLPASSSHPEPNSSLGRRETLHLRENSIFSKYKSKRNCFVPAQKLLESIFIVALQEEKQMWDLQLLIALIFLEKSLSIPLLVGIFLQSQSLPILVDLKNGEWNPFLFIIQKPLTRFWHKASLAQSRAHGQLENIPEPFNNPWLVFKLKTKAEMRESLQIFRLYKKTSVQLVINSHHLFSVIFMLGESLSLQTLLLPQRA